MPLFNRSEEDRRNREHIRAEDAPPDVNLKEELSELVATGDRREVDRALSDAERAVTDATSADIRGLKMIERGRCPECSARTHALLYTIICPNCGWYRRQVPDVGRCRVHLDNDEVVECDRVFPAKGGAFLCVTDGVVVDFVVQQYVKRVEYLWSPEELSSERERMRRARTGLCSWCESDLTQSEEGGPYDEYVAFGAVQEHYVFCSKKCMEAFRRQYPSRIHRNCYETDCAVCDKCVKRYDVDGFRRVLLV
jgi:hypothetical protein